MYQKHISFLVLAISSITYSSHQCKSNDPYIECKNTNHFRIEKYYHSMFCIFQCISYHENYKNLIYPSTLLHKRTSHNNKNSYSTKCDIILTSWVAELLAIVRYILRKRSMYIWITYTVVYKTYSLYPKTILYYNFFYYYEWYKWSGYWIWLHVNALKLNLIYWTKEYESYECL